MFQVLKQTVKKCLATWRTHISLSYYYYYCFSSSYHLVMINEYSLISLSFTLFPDQFIVMYFVFLGLEIKTGELAEACSKSPIHISNCSHEACVQICVEKYGESINGGCINNVTCCCHIGQKKMKWKYLRQFFWSY